MNPRRIFWYPRSGNDPKITLSDTVYSVLLQEARQSRCENWERAVILIGREKEAGHFLAEAVLDHDTCTRLRIFRSESPFWTQYDPSVIEKAPPKLLPDLKEFSRILAHTHAGDGAVPSPLDRDNSDYQREVGICVDLGLDGQLEATGYVGEYFIPVYYQDRLLSPWQDSGAS